MAANPSPDLEHLKNAQFALLQDAPAAIRHLKLAEIVRNTSLDGLATCLTGGTDNLRTLPPQINGATLDDVIKHIKMIQTATQQDFGAWSLGQCIDSWARSQQSQLAALPASSEQIIHRSVVVGAAPPALDHPQTIAPPTLPVGFNLTAAGVLPILPQFALPGTPLLGPSLLPQHLPLSDAALEEEAKRVAAAAARAARQQKRREAKARQETKRKRDDEIAVEAAATAAAAATLPGGVPQLEVQADAGVKPVRPQVPESRGDRSDMRAIKNRESAARSRAKRVEYTAALEAHVEKLREQNKSLRTKIVQAAAAPPDPHAGSLDGAPLRRTRTMPL